MVSKSIFIAKKVKELVEPILEDIGFELVEAEYLSSRGKWVLRLTIDKEGGVSIDDCARVSREVGDLIDIKDVIEHEYVLEVSSPGLDRPLTREKDIEGAVGKKIKVKMNQPLEGRRVFTGVLKAYQGGDLHLETENQMMVLPRAGIAKANLVYEFE